MTSQNHLTLVKGPDGSSQPATSPPLQWLTIIHPLLGQTSESATFLSTLYPELNMGVDPAHYAHLRTGERRCVDNAYFNRCADIGDVIEIWKYVKAGGGHRAGLINWPDSLQGATRHMGTQRLIHLGVPWRSNPSPPTKATAAFRK